MTDQGILQIYGWSIEPDDFPTDAPTISPASAHQLVVVQSQFADFQNYQLTNITTGETIRWQSISQKGRQLTLDPGPLSPGEYEFISPTDSMFGGSTYEFFTIQ